MAADPADVNMEVHDPSEDRAPVSGDSGPGTGIKDLLPLPSDTNPVTDPFKTEHTTTLRQDATLSHALAKDDHDVKGLAQQDHDHEVLDLGWNEKKQNIMRPLVGGMDNETLWMLIRRFNKQIYHVKATPFQPPGGLDLNIADDEEFSPDKLRTSIERFYMNIVVSIMGVFNHIARLRSWREKRRTAGFCAAYFIAWTLDLLVPMLTATVIALITYPPSRQFLFPPAPIALVNKDTGGVQKPPAGVLGSHDSATGAPENHKGEAVEKEASNFVDGIASMAVTSATAAGDVPDQTDSKHDKTKKPLETVMWAKMKPITHGLNDVIDTWERFANALSPISPFPENTYRLRLAGLVLPLFIVSLFVTSYMFVKGVTFGVGFGFFGDPVISRGLRWLNRAYPNWQKLLEMRNTILKGVPTNAQLTLTLLRIGEAHNAPIPPPPRIDQPPPQRPAQLDDRHLRATAGNPPLNATESEIDLAVQNDPNAEMTETGDADIERTRHPLEGSVKGKRWPKVVEFFRGISKGAVKTAVGADHVRAKATGAHAAKDRLGVIQASGEAPISGPVEFKGRYDGKKGHVYITKKATIPSVGFSVKDSLERVGLEEKEQVNPEWSVAVADIVELKKVGGYGWKAKMVVGWSLGRDINDGLEIVSRTGERYKVTAMPLRDELFNRLVAMGGQKWEAL